jgi:hypothetical protein
LLWLAVVVVCPGIFYVMPYGLIWSAGAVLLGTIAGADLLRAILIAQRRVWESSQILDSCGILRQFRTG